MSTTAERVSVILIEHLALDAEQITPEAQLDTDLSADSLDVVELVMAFEDEFRVEIPDDLIKDESTVEQICVVIDSRLALQRA